MSAQLFDEFIFAHVKDNLDPTKALMEWIDDGYILSSKDALLIGGDDPDGRKDVWFVYWAGAGPAFKGNQLAAIKFFLDWMPFYRPYVKFNRGVRGKFAEKIYSTDRLRRLTG
jgi:hypothetical protein